MTKCNFGVKYLVGGNKVFTMIMLFQVSALNHKVPINELLFYHTLTVTILTCGHCDSGTFLGLISNI